MPCTEVENSSDEELEECMMNITDEQIEEGVKMMEKIEELTLYMIDLKKENENLKAEVATLKKAQK